MTNISFDYRVERAFVDAADALASIAATYKKDVAIREQQAEQLKQTMNNIPNAKDLLDNIRRKAE